METNKGKVGAHGFTYPRIIICMINLPKIGLKRAGTKITVDLTMEGDLFPSRGEWLELNAHKYLSRHRELSRKDIIVYLFWLIRDKDFVIFEFGDNPWHYIQFIKEGENLSLDFPYSVTLGARSHMVDRVELILKRHGFTRFTTPWTFNTLHYEDSLYNSLVALDASFGNRRNQLAADITIAIATEIFGQREDGKWKVTLGSQHKLNN